MKFHKIVLTGVGLILLSSNANAVPCNGYSANQHQDPIVVHKGEDGSQSMMLGRTETLFFTLEPKGDPGDGARARCTGVWKSSPDGKTGVGAGHCYNIARNGDMWISDWTGDESGGGTWKLVWATGIFEKRVGDSGTWKTGWRNQDQSGVNYWEGDCTPLE